MTFDLDIWHYSATVRIIRILFLTVKYVYR